MTTIDATAYINGGEIKANTDSIAALYTLGEEDGVRYGSFEGYTVIDTAGVLAKEYLDAALETVCPFSILAFLSHGDVNPCRLLSQALLMLGSTWIQSVGASRGRPESRSMKGHILSVSYPLHQAASGYSCVSSIVYFHFLPGILEPKVA